MRKKTIGLLVGVLCSFAAFCFVGCSQSQGETPPPEQEQEISEILFDKSAVTITLGDTVGLSYTEKGTVIGEEIWTSSAPDYVSVNEEGEVTALQTTDAPVAITLTKGDISDVCQVTVDLGGQLPALRSSALPEENGDFVLSVTVGSEIDMGFSVYFNNRFYDDATFTYDFDGDELGSFANGIFTAGNESGMSELTVTASWRGVDSAALIRKVRISVQNEYVIKLNGGTSANDIALYTTSSFAGKTYENSLPFVIDVEENGVALADDKVQVSLAEVSDLVALENDRLYGVGSGKGNIIITFLDSDGNTRMSELPVSVVRPVETYETVVKNFSAADGELGIPYATLFENYVAGETEITAFEGDRQLTVENGKILGVSDSAEGKNVTTVSVYTREAGWNITLEVYTKVIKEAEDLAYFKAIQSVTKTEVGDNLYYYYSGTADSEYAVDYGFYKNVNGVATFCYYSTKTSKNTTGKTNANTLANDAYGLLSGTTVDGSVKDLDVSYFRTSSGSYYKVSRFDGYYVLGKDIEADGYELARATDYPVTGYSSHPVLGIASLGLQGTFDGQGYVVRGLTLDQGGVFGQIGAGATVKNVAFTDVQWSESANTYKGVLASFIEGNKTQKSGLENVYIQAQTLPNTNYAGLVASQIEYNAHITNCVFEVSEKGMAGANYGIFGSKYNWDKVTDMSVSNANWQNVIVLSEMPLIASQDGWVIDDKNYVDNGTKKAKITSISRFIDYGAMAEGDSAKLFETFNTLYWSETGDLLLYRACEETFFVEKAALLVDGETFDGEVANDGESHVLSVSVKGLSVELVSLTTGDTGILEIVENKIKPLTTGTATLCVAFAYNGVTYEKDFIVNVIAVYETITGNVYYSTADTTLYLVDGETTQMLTGASVTTITGDSVDLSNTANAVKTIENVLLTIDGESYLASVQSVEKVIAKAEDLAYFKMGVQLKGDGLTDVLYVNYNSTTVYKYGDETALGTGALDSNNALTYNGEVISVFKTSGGSYYEYKSFGGYYVVICDIDATNYTLPRANDYGSNSYTSTPVLHTLWCGLQGTFEGNGHTIDGLTVGSQQGIFGSVSANGLIKNVAFTNVRFTSTDNNTGLLASFFGGKIMNCYIQAAALANAEKNVGLVAGTFHSGAVITNSLFKVEEKGTNNQGYGVLAGNHNLFSTGNRTKLDCTIISSLPVITDGSKSLVASGETADNTISWEATNVVRYATLDTLLNAENASVYAALKASFTTDNGDAAAKAMWTEIFAGFEK